MLCEYTHFPNIELLMVESSDRKMNLGITKLNVIFLERAWPKEQNSVILVKIGKAINFL